MYVPRHMCLSSTICVPEDSDPQVWQQAPLTAEPSCWPQITYLKSKQAEENLPSLSSSTGEALQGMKAGMGTQAAGHSRAQSVSLGSHTSEATPTTLIILRIPCKLS